VPGLVAYAATKRAVKLLGCGHKRETYRALDQIAIRACFEVRTEETGVAPSANLDGKLAELSMKWRAPR
jgi:hypothetical protein